MSQAIHDQLIWALRELTPSSESPQLDGELLLCFACGKQARRELYHVKSLTPYQTSFFCELVMRRAWGEPVAYLTGTKEFYSLTFQTDSRALVPRADTETWVDHVVTYIKGNTSVKSICDVGVGTGAILLSVLSQVTDRPLLAVGTDISAEARSLAIENAHRLVPTFCCHPVIPAKAGIHSYSGVSMDPRLRGDDKKGGDDITQTTLRHTVHIVSPEAALSLAPFDVVVSNPPYLTFEEWLASPKDVHVYEPQSALYTQRALFDWIGEMGALLSSSGMLFMEWGDLSPEWAQSGETRAYLQAHGFAYEQLIHSQPKCNCLVLRKQG